MGCQHKPCSRTQHLHLKAEGKNPNGVFTKLLVTPQKKSAVLLATCILLQWHQARSFTRLYLAEQEAYIEHARHEQKASAGPTKGAGVGSPLKPQPWAFWGENRRMSYSSSRAAGAVQVERSQLALLPHAKLPRAASALPLQITAWEVATIKKVK